MTPTEALNILTQAALMRRADGLSLQQAAQAHRTIIDAGDVLKAEIEPREEGEE